jgi:hypothetical protein
VSIWIGKLGEKPGITRLIFGVSFVFCIINAAHAIGFLCEVIRVRTAGIRASQGKPALDESAPFAS